MLSRVLEPELMDTAAEAADYDAMDHAEVNHRFVHDLMAAFPRLLDPKRAPLKLLDVGTGTAQIPIELCRRTQDLQVVAVDAAVHMLHLARRNIAAAEFDNRIQVHCANAKRLPFSARSFDGVISNSIVHHLADPWPCLSEAVRITASGGLLFFRDLFRPAEGSEVVRLVDRYAPPAGISAAGDHQRKMFSDSLQAAFTVDEIRELITRLGFQPSSVQSTSDRHWTWSAQK